MASLPPFCSRAHLAKTAGLQRAGRATGFGEAAAEQRGPPGHLKGVALGSLLCYASKGSEAASDALDEPCPCSSSLRAHLQGVHNPSSSSLANPTEPAVRLHGFHERSPSSLRRHLARPAEPVVTLQSAGRRMGIGKVRGRHAGAALGLTCYAVRRHLARSADPVVTLQSAGRRMGFGKVRGSPGHLKGAALGLTCYASGSEPPSSLLDDGSSLEDKPSSFLNDPSASSSLHDKLDLVHDKLDLFHRELCESFIS